MARQVDIIRDLVEVAAESGWTLNRATEGALQFEIKIAGGGGISKYITVFVGPRGGVEATLRTYTFGSHWEDETSGRLARSTVARWLRSP